MTLFGSLLCERVKTLFLHFPFSHRYLSWSFRRNPKIEFMPEKCFFRGLNSLLLADLKKDVQDFLNSLEFIRA